MTTINSDGLKIEPQNLANVSPSDEDHFRLFSHDGTEAITTTLGYQFSNSGFYLWDNLQQSWKPLRNTVTDTELFAGKSPSEYLLDVEEDSSLLSADVSAIDFTGHLNVSDDGDGTVTIDPTHNHDSQYANINTGGTQIISYATLSDVPNTLTKGDTVYIEDKQRLYVEDGN